MAQEHYKSLVPEGIIQCRPSGQIISLNQTARNILKFDGELSESDNILNYISSPQVSDILKLVLSFPGKFSAITRRDILYVNITTHPKKTYLVSFNKRQKDTILLKFIDFDEHQIQDQIAQLKLEEQTRAIIRSNNILKAITEICKNILGKNRSHIDDILKTLCTALELDNAVMCFKNGALHSIVCTKDETTSEYKIIKLDRDCNSTMCYTANLSECGTQSVLEHNNCSNGCLEHLNLETHKNLVIPLRLEGSVLGFLNISEDIDHELSQLEIEAIENLSNILAFVVYNKEEQNSIIEHIKQRFDTLNQQVL